MAYLIVSYKDRELFRRELAGPVIIGRSPECQVSVRDVLLSRRHCQIEPAGSEWVISDLNSKNGTRVGGEKITHRILSDRDLIRMGKTSIRFLKGTFEPAAAEPSTPARRAGGIQRPADPFEALAGTVSDFVFEPAPGAPAAPSTPASNPPTPRPGPREPASYGREDIRAFVTELVSSSWDSIYEGASRPDPILRTSGPVRRIQRLRPPEPHLELMLKDDSDSGDGIAGSRSRQQHQAPTLPSPGVPGEGNPTIPDESSPAPQMPAELDHVEPSLPDLLALSDPPPIASAVPARPKSKPRWWRTLFHRVAAVPRNHIPNRFFHSAKASR